MIEFIKETLYNKESLNMDNNGKAGGKCKAMSRTFIMAKPKFLAVNG